MRASFQLIAGLLLTLPLLSFADSSQRYSWSQDFSEDLREQQIEEQGTSQALPAMETQQRDVINTPKPLQKNHCTNCDLPEVSLGNVQTELIYDDDYDGYYHRFEVSFDVISQDLGEALYARLYLAKTNAKWNFLYQTKDFVISGDTARDRRVIVNALDSGYAAGHYELRIALYDADTDSFIIDISSADDAAMSDLPLEDYERDDYYYYNGNQFYGYAAGAFGWPMLVLLGAAAAWRRRR